MKFSKFIAIGCALLVGWSAGVRAEEEKSTVSDGLTTQPWTLVLGTEFPGAAGKLSQEKIEEQEALNLSYDFTGGGGYVAAKTKVEVGEGVKKITFQVKAERNLPLFVRVIDSGGQVHQYQVTYRQSQVWLPMEVELSGKTTHFGGENDGIIHYPIKGLLLGVSKGKGTNAEPGNVSFSKIQFFTPPAE